MSYIYIDPHERVQIARERHAQRCHANALLVCGVNVREAAERSGADLLDVLRWHDDDRPRDVAYRASMRARRAGV